MIEALLPVPSLDTSDEEGADLSYSNSAVVRLKSRNWQPIIAAPRAAFASVSAEPL